MKEMEARKSHLRYQAAACAMWSKCYEEMDAADPGQGYDYSAEICRKFAAEAAAELAATA